LPERTGISLVTANRPELTAKGLEAAESVKTLFLNPEHLGAAQWCLEEDAAARSAAGRDHWRNIASGQSSAGGTALRTRKARNQSI
jgi:hypothetical protein